MAALNLLDDLGGRKIAVLGDMLELGQYEKRGHELVGSRAAEIVNILVTLGERGRIIADAALQSGMASRIDRTSFDTTDQVAAHLKKILEIRRCRSDQRITRHAHGPHRGSPGGESMRDASLAITLSGLSFMLAVIWGGPLLRVLKHFKLGKQIRVEEPDRHMIKMGTPTMGGFMIILPVAFLTILLNAVSIIGLEVIGRSILVPLIVMIGYGLLGAVDDWEGIRGVRKGSGMRARTKFIFQVLFALVIALVLRYMLDVPQLYLAGPR